MAHEADECDCHLCTDEYYNHGLANIAQLEYFKQREIYKNLSHKDLIDTLKTYGVPDVLREVIEGRLAELESV